MRQMTLWTSAVAVLIAATLAAGQQQPLPRPVTPPVPIPGKTPVAPSNGSADPNNPAPPAAEPRVVPAGEPAITPYLDNQTLAVARFDLADLDINAVRQWVPGAVDELRKTDKEILRARQDVNQELGDVFDAIGKFRSAGAKQVYGVVSLADLTEGRPPALIVPMAQGADAKALQSILNGDNAKVPALTPADRGRSTAPIAEVVNNAVVFAAPGTIDRLKSLQPAARPDVQKAFASAGRGHIHIAIVPQEEARKLLEKALPTLPQELGGGSIEPVSRGIQWGELTIDLPPNPALRLLVQARDAQSAAALEGILDKCFSFLEAQKEGPPAALAWKRLLGELRPKAQGDRLVTDLTGDQTRQVAGVLAANLIHARNQAKSIETANHLRQLGIAVMMYADANHGRLPKALGDEVNPFLKDAPDVWTDPLRPHQKKPYVYIHLADTLSQVKGPGRSVMIYENHTTWDDGINVEFADSHVEWVTSEKEFKQMLDQTRQLNPAAVEMPQ